uniref:complement C1r-A subcomponent-like n=1 Tax=Pristiophorus japonicus TaxID=55135 RepID=UPI00398F4307
MFGEISSPDYPAPYPNDTQAKWSIEVPLGYRVKLQFSFFQVEPSQRCIYDHLKVSSEGKSLGSFCGSDNTISGNPPGRQLLISKRNTMDLEFKSDFSNEGTYLGFLIHYEAIDVDECETQVEDTLPCDHLCHNSLGSYFCSCHHGYQLQDDGKSCKVGCQQFFNQISGHVMSPDYPRPYPPNLNCNYSIRVEQGFVISLEFRDVFEIDSHHEVHCPYDDLTIEYRDIVKGPLCGNQKLTPFETQSNAVNILFNTDGSGDSRGWKIRYTTDRIKCPHLHRLDHGRLHPIQEHYRFLDHMTFTCDVGYKIMKIDKELKAFKMVCTGTGEWNKEIIPTCNSESGLTRVILTRWLCPLDVSGRYKCTVSRHWVNNDVGETIPYCAPVCGKPENSVTSGATGRIFGGLKAPAGSFPWQVYLHSPQGYRAGAILIDHRWVMTAAHVFYPKGEQRPTQEKMLSFKVFMGDNDLEDLINMSPVSMKRVYLHPGFSGDSAQYRDDLALIELRWPVRLTADVAPICLPPAGLPALYRPGLLGYVAGWGVTQDRLLLNQLHYVGLPMADQDRCAASLRRAQGGGAGAGGEDLVLTAGMFCAGTGLGETDSCQGDSGGAYAVHRRDEDTWYVTGIVSWGLGCGRNATYGVYTRVTQYLQWINRTMASGDPPHPLP